MRLFKKLITLILVLNYLGLKGQASAKAFVDHVSNDGIDAVGNISLTVTGGTSPYTYSWTPGAITSKDYTNAAIDSYTVKITDNASNVTYYYYKLGYKADWINHYGTFARNDSLIADPGIGYTYNTAITKNTLIRNADGWVEYVIPAWTSHNHVGFIDSTAASYDGWISDIDFGFHLTTSNTLYAWSGGGYTYIGSVNEGDVLRIARVSSNYELILNNSTIHTASTNANTKLKFKAMIMAQPLVNIGVSFSDTTYLERLKAPLIAIDHVDPDDIDSLGTIRLGISTGTYPYTYSWSPGSFTTKDLTEKERDNYTIKIKDADNDSTISYVSLGYKTDWRDYWGSSSVKDTLISNAATTPSGSPSAFSVNELRPNQAGWAQYVVQAFDSPYVIGLADTLLPGYRGSMDDVNFAVHVTYGYALYGWNGGWNYLGTTKEGDVLKIEKSGSVFTLKNNGSTTFTHTATNTKNYKVKALLNNYIRMGSIGTSFADSTTGRALLALADVDHLRGDGVDSLGSIRMKVYGGSTPYTYTWKQSGVSDVTTKHRDDLAMGTYSLRVVDYKNDSTKHVYNLGYKAKWNNFYGTALSNDSLVINTFTFSSGNFPTSRIIDSLAKDSSGWAEKVIRPFISAYVVGFLDSAYTTASSTDLDFAFHITTGNALYAYYGGSFYYLSGVNVGDVIKIGRSGTTYSIQNNGTSVCTITLAITKALQLKAQLVGPTYVTEWSPLVNVGVGFIKKCTGTATIVGGPDIYFTLPDAVNLNCTVTAGTPPYSVQWFPNYFFNTPTYNYTMLNTYVSPSVGLTYYAFVTDNFGCKITKSVTVTPAPYAPLQSTPDGGYYKLTNNKMLFKFDGQYAATTLAFNVYDKANNLVTVSSISSSVVNSGDNRYYLDATNLDSGQYYTLEVINEKKEKRYLRFKR